MYKMLLYTESLLLSCNMAMEFQMIGFDCSKAIATSSHLPKTIDNIISYTYIFNQRYCFSSEMRGVKYSSISYLRNMIFMISVKMKMLIITKLKRSPLTRVSRSIASGLKYLGNISFDFNIWFKKLSKCIKLVVANVCQSVFVRVGQSKLSLTPFISR